MPCSWTSIIPPTVCSIRRTPLSTARRGYSRLAVHLRPGGIFALWSNDRPDDAFTARLGRIFADARAEEVTFHNPLQDKPFTQTIYLAKKQATSAEPSGFC